MNRQVIHTLVIVMLVAVTFGRSLGNGFVWDDQPVIVENPAVQGEVGIVALLTAEDTIPGLLPTGYYRPLTYLSFKLDELLWGGRAAGFHATNLAIHAAVAVVLYLFLISLAGNPAVPLLATLLFALNPVTVEAVSFISGGRNTMLCALFALLALLMHRRGAAGRAAFCILAAAASKEAGFLLPIALLAYDVLVEKKLRVWWRYALYLLPLLLLLMVRVFVVSHGARTTVTPGSLLLAPELVLRYLSIVVVPLFHRVAYSAPVPSPLSFPFLGALAGCGLLATLMAVLRRNRLFVFGMAWFLAFLLPALALAGSYKIPMADRHVYLPAIGIAIALSGLLSQATGRRQAALLGLVVLIFAGSSFAAVPVWRDNGALFERMVQDAPLVETGYTELAKQRLQSGHLDQALGVIESGENSGALSGRLARFIRLGMNCTEAERLLHKGEVTAAEQLIAEVLRLEPDFVPALIDAGSIAAARGELRRAIMLFTRAAELQPKDPAPRYNLVEAYRLLGDPVAAARELTEYRRLQDLGKTR